MLIEARLAPAAARLWQLHVVESLAALPGNTVVVAPVPAARLPRGAEALLALEGLVARGRGVGAGARVGADAFAPYLRPSEGPADLVVDLAGGPDAAGSAPVIDIDCDGEAPEAGALGAALDGAAPVLATRLRDAGGERVLSRWRPAVEAPWSLAASFDMILGRAAHMIVREVGRMGRGSGEAAPRPAPHSRRSAGSFFLASLEARIARRLARTLGRAPNWYVAWRSSAADPEAIPDLAGPFRRLADDGARFYADPFLWCAGGETLLFVEEFPFATGKGVISLARRGDDGSFGKPEPILEASCHLSYPFVFARDGAMWMIPETSGRRTVELWRAERFPDRWTLHAVLLDDVDLADATICEIGGRLWMFAASREPWTSSWDALSLFSAETLAGPWIAHPDNPVMVDLKAARPAGRILRCGDRLVRPVQDCEAGYGAALGFAAIDTISPGDYRQTILAVARPAPPDSRLHTYDRAGGLEVIDRFGPR